MVEYRHRCIEKVIKTNLDAYGAIQIVGPKYCGKTTTALQFSRSKVEFGNPSDKDRLIKIFYIEPKRLLVGDIPRLFDEWQVIPELWDMIRYDLDTNPVDGKYILTGSVNIDRANIVHTGTGRITTIRMSTMSLRESGDSTGEMSISNLFNSDVEPTCESSHDIQDIAELIERGGWPGSLGKNKTICRAKNVGYCESLLDYDISHVDGKRRDPTKMRIILRSLARNESTEAKNTSILDDINNGGNYSMNINTLQDYLKALEMLYIKNDLQAWCPNLRSKTAIRTSPVRHLVDPSIGMYFIGASADDLIDDPNTFGLYFESMAIRDLRAYSLALDGTISHYRDSDGLEADAIMHLHDGRWAAFEVKLSTVEIDSAAANLIKLSNKVDGRKPSFLAVITANGYAYRRKDGVYVIPIGCLGP